jgi:urease accessory protein
MLLRPLTASVTFLALTAAALAHAGHGDASGFAHGMRHPFGGLDHVLAMVAVGLYAAMLAGRPLWPVPATFLSVMAIGGALGIAGIALPYVEIGIGISVVVLGVAMALRLSLPAAAAMALVGLFAIFHGHAHGAEMPPEVSGTAYASGFMLATAMLLCTGIGLGLLAARLGERGWRIVRTAGGAMALVGLAILAGVA